MWSNSLWEQENQEELKERLLYQCLNGGPMNFVSPVRRITCEGCGSTFYTTVPTKKYCNERCCYLGFWKRKREKRLEKRKAWSVRSVAKSLRPNAPMPYIAATPAGRTRTGKALRLMVSDHFGHSARSVTRTAEKK